MKHEILRIESVNKAFGNQLVLSDINFTPYKGEALSVLGENGAGKTTLMNILAGVYSLDAGKLAFLCLTIRPGFWISPPKQSHAIS